MRRVAVQHDLRGPAAVRVGPGDVGRTQRRSIPGDILSTSSIRASFGRVSFCRRAATCSACLITRRMFRPATFSQVVVAVAAPRPAPRQGRVARHVLEPRREPRRSRRSRSRCRRGRSRRPCGCGRCGRRPGAACARASGCAACHAASRLLDAAASPGTAPQALPLGLTSARQRSAPPRRRSRARSSP